MKEWSKLWKASKKPKKQRKYSAEAPLHVKRKFLGTHLSKDLRKKHSIRKVPLRTGDKIKVLRGRFRGKSGSVDRVDTYSASAYITGIEVVKKDGSKVSPPIKTSNLMITDLNLNDKRRLKKVKKEEKSEKTKESRS